MGSLFPKNQILALDVLPTQLLLEELNFGINELMDLFCDNKQLFMWHLILFFMQGQCLLMDYHFILKRRNVESLFVRHIFCKREKEGGRWGRCTSVFSPSVVLECTNAHIFIYIKQFLVMCMHQVAGAVTLYGFEFFKDMVV